MAYKKQIFFCSKIVYKRKCVFRLIIGRVDESLWHTKYHFMRDVFRNKILISLDMRIVWYVFIDIISVYILWHSIWYKFMAVWFINVTMPILNTSFSRIYFSMESENLYTFTAAINLAYCSLFSLMISIQAFYKLLVHLFCDLYVETYIL